MRGFELTLALLFTALAVGLLVPYRAAADQTLFEAVVSRSLDARSSEIYFQRLDGGMRIRLTNDDFFDINPSLSPDGTKVVFESQTGPTWRDIIVVDLKDGSRFNLTSVQPGMPYYNVDPAWSPDGSQIVFTSSRRDAYNHELYVMDADGSNQRRLTNNAEPDYWPSWSPDGTTIAFGRYVGGTLEGAEIFLLDLATGVETRLTDNTAADTNPGWSPDGERLVFESTRDGNPEIYVMDRDGTGVRRLTDNAAPDSGPDWSPDGARIVFSSVRGDPPGPKLWMMNADGTGETEFMGITGDAVEWGVAAYEPSAAHPLPDGSAKGPQIIPPPTGDGGLLQRTRLRPS